MFKDSIRLLRICAVLASLVSPLLASAGVNSWTAIGGLPGGLVNRIVHHPTQSEIVYLTSNSGLYRSGNAGQSWQLVGTQPRSWPYDIAVHPTHPDRVYVVANDSEVLTSDDAGVTFQLLSTFPFGEASNEIEISGDGTTIYVGGGTRLHRSIDAGHTWQTLPQIATSSGLHSLLVDPRDADTLVALFSDSSAFHTVDGGVTWQPMNLPSVEVLSIDISRSGAQKIWAGTAQGTWVSSDLGASWVPTSMQGVIRTINVDPTDPAVVYAGRSADDASNGLYRSTDEGGHWTNIQADVRTGSIQTVAIDPQQPNRLLVAGEENLWSTTDGGTNWVAANTGLASSTVYQFSAAAGSDRIYMGVATGGLYFVRNGEDTARPVNNEARRVLATTPASLGSEGVLAQAGDADRLFVSGYRSARSQDGGESWTILAPAAFNFKQVGTFAAWPADTQVLLAGTHGGGMFRTSDGGDLWSPVTGLPADSEISAIAMSGNVTPTAYASGEVSDNNGITGHGVYKSLDGGQNWVAANTGISSSMVRDIAVHPESAETVYAATHLGLMKTTDAGATWSASPLGPSSDMNTLAVAIDPLHPSIVYPAGTGSGTRYVRRSVDSGVTWQELRQPDVGVHLMRIYELGTPRLSIHRVCKTSTTGKTAHC